MTNSRFEDLERRCQKIKKVRIAKVILACTLISLVPFGYIYFTLKVNNIDVVRPIGIVPQVQSANNTTVEVVEKILQVPIVESIQEEKVGSEENSTQMSPHYDTLMLSPNIKNTTKKIPLEEKINLDPPPTRNGMLDFDGKEEKRTAEETKKIINLSIKSVGDEEALLKNFHSSNNFKTAYSLAEFYFNKKEYLKSISWSKEASRLEPTSDKPWIIYAKSKFYLGDKSESIRSLEVFLAYASSKEAKDLLNFYKGQQ